MQIDPVQHAGARSTHGARRLAHCFGHRLARRTAFGALALASVAAFALAPATVSAKEAHAAHAGTVRLLFHGGVAGEIVDCGCKNKPLGGLARRAALIETLSEGRNDVAVVDAGGLFGENNAEKRAQTAFLVEQTAALPYDAFGVGAADLGLGVEFAQQAHERNHLAFTSANVMRGDQPLFAPYRVVDHGGLQVGYVSVLDPGAFVTGRTLPEGVALEDPATTLRRVLPELRAKADVVVLLAHTKRDGLDALLASLGEDVRIDVAVDGSSAMPLRSVRRVGQTMVVGANGRGKYLGQLDLTVAADGTVRDSAFTLHEIALSLPEHAEFARRVESFRAEHGQLAQKP